jgi:hypothetical protein
MVVVSLNLSPGIEGKGIDGLSKRMSQLDGAIKRY